jgi:hypothetical protein
MLLCASVNVCGKWHAGSSEVSTSSDFVATFRNSKLGFPPRPAWVQDQDFLFELLTHQADRLGQVQIIGDNHRRFLLVVETVHQEVGRDVDICS